MLDPEIEEAEIWFVIFIVNKIYIQKNQTCLVNNSSNDM